MRSLITWSVIHNDLLSRQRGPIRMHSMVIAHAAMVFYITFTKLKRHNQGEIIKKSVLLFWLLDMSIIYQHVHRLELRKLF